MSYEIEVQEPGQAPRRVGLDHDVRAGREGVELVLHSPSVSRQHLQLRSTAAGLSAVDLGSTNGTTLNGLPLEVDTDLRVGDVLRAGDVTITIVAVGATEPEPPPTQAAPEIPLASREVGSTRITWRPGSPGAHAADAIADDVRRAQRQLDALVPRSEQPSLTIRVVDPLPAPSGSGEILTGGTVVDARANTIWMIVTAESPPEPVARALALMLASHLPGGDDLDLLLEGYGSHIADLGDADGPLRGLPLPSLAAADGPLRSAMALSFVRYLIGLSGEDDLIRLLQTAAAGDVDAAVAKVYGRGLAVLELRWRQRLESGEPPVKATRFLRLAGRYLRPHVRREAEMFVYMLAGLGFTVVFPFQFRKLLDTAIPSGEFSQSLSILLVLGAALAISLLAGLRRAYLSAYVSSAVVRQVRREMFERLQSLHMGWFTNRQQGDVLSRLFSDVGLLEAGLSQTLREGAFQLLSLLVASAVLVALNPLLAVVVLVGVPLVGLVYRLMAAGAERRSIAVQEEIGVVVSVTAENFSAQPVVKAFGLERLQAEQFATASDRLFDKQIRLQLFGGLFGLSVNMIVTILRLAVLALGSWLVLQGDLTIGGLVAFVSLMGEAISPVTVLTGIGQQIQASTGALTRINEVLEAEPAIADPSDAMALAPLSREIAFTDVGFSYEPDRATLQGLQLVIEAGQRTALVGPTGAGKSSVLQLLMRFYDPQHGHISFDGQDIRGASLASLRGQLGVVFQDTFLFEGTLRENVAIGRPSATAAEIDLALEAAELADFVRSLPAGVNTLVGERGARLSGGQRQRLAIARALLRDPRVLILDEATSALDPRTESLIADTLARVSAGRTTIAVTHRLTSITDYDKIVVLTEGRIVEVGRHPDLLAAGGLYASLWSEQTSAPEPSVELDPTQALRSISLFADASSEALAEAVGFLRVETLSPNTTLAEDSGRLVILASGEATLLGPTLSGSLTPIARLRQGDAFGLGAVLGQPAGLVLDPDEQASILVLNEAAIRTLATDHPSLAATLRGTEDQAHGPMGGAPLARLTSGPFRVVRQDETPDLGAQEANRMSGTFRQIQP